MFLLELDSDFQALDSKEASVHAKTCHKCGKGELRQRAEMRFIHFYQFPIFPLLPVKQTYCQRCHKVFKRERLSVNVFPAWRIAAKFLGLFAIILFAINSWNTHKEQQQLEVSYLQQPANFDVWIINETKLLGEEGQDSRFKVVQVLDTTDDQVAVKTGQVLYPSVSNAIKAIRLDNLLIYNYFSNTPEHFDKSQLQALKQQGVIYSAHRPKNLSLFGGIVMRQPMPKPFRPTHRPNPLNQEAIGLYQQGQLEEAAKLFEQAANQGSAWAQYNIAGMYLEGQGVANDIEKAKSYLQMAADQGFTRANEALNRISESKGEIK